MLTRYHYRFADCFAEEWCVFDYDKFSLFVLLVHHLPMFPASPATASWRYYICIRNSLHTTILARSAVLHLFLSMSNCGPTLWAGRKRGMPTSILHITKVLCPKVPYDLWQTWGKVCTLLVIWITKQLCCASYFRITVWAGIASFTTSRALFKRWTAKTGF